MQAIYNTNRVHSRGEKTEYNEGVANASTSWPRMMYMAVDTTKTAINTNERREFHTKSPYIKIRDIRKRGKGMWERAGGSSIITRQPSSTPWYLAHCARRQVVAGQARSNGQQTQCNVSMDIISCVPNTLYWGCESLTYIHFEDTITPWAMNETRPP